MKVITLKQPWATLIAEGYKKYEFRSWDTNYRSEILIHAGKGVDKAYLKKYEHLNLTYPTARIVAKVSIVDTIKLNQTTNDQINKENELIYGNYKREGYAWKIDNVVKINSNKEIKGKLSIWNIQENEF
ncbi:MAG: ASCH domain-containing protein [Bacilli bacterium]|nr:ASCH domain-containing protein [Bacilli bacterium]